MGAGERPSGDLHVDSRFPLEEPVLLKQLLADFDEPRGRILAAERDSDPIQALLEPLVVEPRREKPSVDGAKNLVDAIPKYKSAIFHRHACFRSRHEAAVYVDDILWSHFR